MSNAVQSRRCAIYTRKSNTAGLERTFNSLQLQRESCANYIASQRAEGLVEIETQYDDGGFSGGNMDRPALKHLLDDIREGLVDVVVVYKIDRLSRSLRDFVKLIEVFESRNVTFISVTQYFNTTSSMGRLVFNVLLSFAQFEREMTSDRLKDKFASLRTKGMWTGPRPLGYQVEKLRLVVDQTEANLVRLIFRRYIAVGSGRAVANELTSEGHVSQCGGRISAAYVIRHVQSRLYRGDLRHHDRLIPETHEPIVTEAIWQKAQEVIATSTRSRAAHRRPHVQAMLKGIIFGPSGHAMLHTFTTGRKGRIYRYYVSSLVFRYGPGSCSVGRFRAADLEEVVSRLIHNLIGMGGIAGIGRVTRGRPSEGSSARAERDMADRHLIVRQVVKRVDIRDNGLTVTLKSGDVYSFPLPVSMPNALRVEPKHGSGTSGDD